LPIGLGSIVDWDDVGVFQSGRGTRLALEPLDELGVYCELGVQYLERNFAIKLSVVSFVDHGEAAAADLFEDLVLADAPAFCHRPAPPFVAGANPLLPSCRKTAPA
jgi:hypothetical protein